MELKVLAKGNDVLLKSLSIEGDYLRCGDPEIVQLFPSLGFDSGGRIDLTQFSDCVVYGCQLWTKGRGGNWLSLVRDAATGRYSTQALKQAFVDENCNTSHYRFVTNWASQGKLKTRLVSVPSPLPSELTPDLPADFNDFATIHGNSAMEAIFKPLHVTYVGLDTRLLAGNGYCVDKKFKSPRKEDYIHLNDDGSWLVLESLLRVLH